jgi:hypothetical protein
MKGFFYAAIDFEFLSNHARHAISALGAHIPIQFQIAQVASHRKGRAP